MYLIIFTLRFITAGVSEKQKVIVIIEKLIDLTIKEKEVKLSSVTLLSSEILMIKISEFLYFCNHFMSRSKIDEFFYTSLNLGKNRTS